MIKNLTPHPLRIQLPDGQLLEFPKSETPARVSSTAVAVEAVAGIPAVETKFGEVYDLPEFQEGVILLVSSMVLSAMEKAGTLTSRPDVWAPDTGPASGAIRKDGQVWAAVRLTRPA